MALVKICIGSDWTTPSARSEQKEVHNGAVQAVTLKSGERVPRCAGVAFVLHNSYTGIPASFNDLLRNYPALHEVVVFITIR